VPEDPVLLGEDLATRLSRPYWEGLHRGELVLQRCSSCARWQHYPRRLCRSCWGPSLEFLPTGGRGRLLASALSHRTPKPALRDRLPIALGLVGLDEGPVLLTCLTERPATGDSVAYDSAQTMAGGLLCFGPEPGTDR
jgi:uncharacterized OB-fold protein